ncbi:MAG: hypothetical protein IJ111_01290 [Eggerthellaceae bacterium]|nr:hypothetical protein [Eggerthellaceae bacterium]
MAFAQSPGALFIGALKPDDKAFVASLLEAAKKAGYTKAVEPCSGQLAMSCMAADAGYTDLEASDITIFSGVLGRYVEGRSIDDMGIAYRETGEAPESAIEVMCEIKRRELVNSAGSVYGREMLRDFDERYDEIAASIRAEMDSLRERIPSLRYFDMDMFDHIERVKDDPHAIVLCMCPTYSGGYERFYKAISDSVVWNEPSYGTFEPPAGYQKLLDATRDAKCLFLMYEEVEAGKCVGEPSYGRHGGRAGINMYLVSNRPGEVEELLGRECSRTDAQRMEASKYPLMPYGHAVTKASSIEVVKVSPENVRYYRKLLTHNFTPSQAGSGYGLVIDGYLAGIFGYNRIATDLGKGQEAAYIGFGMCTRASCRINRLLYAVACQKRSIRMEFDDLKLSAIRVVRTAMITKYPESKEMRGLMKLTAKEEDGRMGWKLSYECAMQDKTYAQCLHEFVDKEEKWLKARNKSA